MGTGCGSSPGAGLGLTMLLGDSLPATMVAGSITADIGAGSRDRSLCVLSTHPRWSPGSAAVTGVSAFPSAAAWDGSRLVMVNLIYRHTLSAGITSTTSMCTTPTLPTSPTSPTITTTPPTSTVTTRRQTSPTSTTQPTSPTTPPSTGTTTTFISST